MTVALNLFVSVLLGWVGFSVAVGVLVYLCAKACEWVARWRHLRRLDALWSERALTRATVSVASQNERPFDRERA